VRWWASTPGGRIADPRDIELRGERHVDVARAARLPLALAALALAGCGGGGETKTTTKAASPPATTPAASGACPVTGKQVEIPPLDAAKTYVVTTKTNLGTFAFELDQKNSPCTTASFASLVRKRFFDGTRFHRIVPGFVIQGGDPTGTGTGGPGYSVVDTPPSTARYTKGVVAMAKTGAEPAGTSGSQFFVVTTADAGLPADYALLGRVTRGLPVVERIGKLGDANEQPTRRVVIRSMTISP
jgi:peptidyl-prolyl cis-trans isomerase B (cyclophilin B)